jgi:hypothetical protein
MLYPFTTARSRTSASRAAKNIASAVALSALLLGLGNAGHAFERNPLLQYIPDNTAKDLGAYTCTDAPGEWAGKCRSVHDFSGMQYDANRHQMVIFGGGHSSTNYNAINTLSLDTLRWKEEYLPTPCSDMRPDNFDWSKGAWMTGSVPGPYPVPAARHTEDLMNMAGDELILVTSVEGNGGPGCLQWPTYGSYEIRSQNQVAHYNFRTKTWTFGAAAAQSYNWPASEYDPVSNKILMFGLDGLSLYDPVTTTRTVYMDFLSGSYPATDERGNPLNYNVIDQTPRYNNTLVYYPPTDKFYYFEKFAGTIFEITLDRANPAASKIVKISYTGEYPQYASIGWAYDSANKMIGGGPVTNVFYAFDPRTKWMQHKTIQGANTGDVSFQTIGYDPINNVYVFVTGEATVKQTWAYRWASGNGEPVPTISLSANPTSVSSGGTTTLNWSTAYATSCVASGGWSGSKPTSGSQTTAALSSTSTFTLSCTGTGGTNTSAVTVTATAPTYSAPPSTPTITDNLPPTAPSSLSGNATASEVKLSWTASTDNVGVAGYKVYRDAKEIAGTTALSYTDNVVTAGSTYGYYVTAFDAAGNISQPSNNSSITVPARSTALSITQNKATWNNVSNDSSATVQWTTNLPSTGVVSYGLSSANLTSSKADSAVATKHSVTLTGLNRRSVYYYVVKVQSPDGTASVTSTVGSFNTR